jgi:hypothetical protein
VRSEGRAGKEWLRGHAGCAGGAAGACRQAPCAYNWRTSLCRFKTTFARPTWEPVSVACLSAMKPCRSARGQRSDRCWARCARGGVAAEIRQSITPTSRRFAVGDAQLAVFSRRTSHAEDGFRLALRLSNARSPPHHRHLRLSAAYMTLPPSIPHERRPPELCAARLHAGSRPLLPSTQNRLPSEVFPRRSGMDLAHRGSLCLRPCLDVRIPCLTCASAMNSVAIPCPSQSRLCIDGLSASIGRAASSVEFCRL